MVLLNVGNQLNPVTNAGDLMLNVGVCEMICVTWGGFYINFKKRPNTPKNICYLKPYLRV